MPCFIIQLPNGQYYQFCYPGSYPQQPTGSPGTAINVPVSNGGVFAQNQFALFPVYDANQNTTAFYVFDVTKPFNDPKTSSRYSWKVEQPAPQGMDGSLRQATIRRIIVTFRDLGQVSTTWTITGTNDNGSIVSSSTSIGWGNAIPTFKLFTTPIDIVFTGMNPQLSVKRSANGGPLSVVKVVMPGEVETASF